MASPWPHRQMGSCPRLPFPGYRTLSSPIPEGNLLSSPDVPQFQELNMDTASREEIKQHIASVLSSDSGLLEEYITEYVRSETISRWLTKRQSRERLKASNLSFVKSKEKHFNSDAVVKKIEHGEYFDPLFSLASALSQLTNSSGFNLYCITGSGKTMTLYNPDVSQWNLPDFGHKSFLISKNTTVAGYVAYTKQPVCVDDIHLDSRFPKRNGNEDSVAVSVLCAPMVLPDGHLLGVIELYRNWKEAEYTERDLATVEMILFWSSLAISKTALCSSLQQQTDMNDFLLEVSRTYLADITDIESIIEHIMRFAKTLVQADRCSLFLLDEKTNELYCNLFDTGEKQNNEAIFEKRNEIRFPSTKGIVGYVATNKCTVSIPEAYADPRFNRDVDKVTGYTTNNIICLPIMGDREVFGVVEMINKKTGTSFTKLDEDNFKMFSIFCALALKYSKIHNQMMEDHNKHEVVLDQLKYIMQSSDEDVLHLQKKFTDRTLLNIPEDFDRFYFCVSTFDTALPDLFIQMINDTCLPDIALPLEDLARFTLTVRRNYRNKPYHNWKHAMTVAHCMYCIMKNHPDVFSKLETLALIVACLAHDIDHRAFSNQYLQKTNHPLANLYPFSTMEEHHYAVLTMLLNEDGHRIFAQLDEASYDFVMQLIRHAILSTDLALFFGNQRSLQELLANGEFDITEYDHRRALMGLMMTACDLCSNAKKWEPTKATVYELYEEFWTEGDLRKSRGISFNSMMNRDLIDDVPEGQIGFYTNITLRCYDTLVQVLPECQELVVLCNENLKRWREEAEKMKIKKEKLEQERKRLAFAEGQDKEGLGVMLRGGMWVVEQSRTEET